MRAYRIQNHRCRSRSWRSGPYLRSSSPLCAENKPLNREAFHHDGVCGFFVECISALRDEELVGSASRDGI